MSNKIKLKIVTPEKVIFEGEVEEIIVPSMQGEMGVLPDHEPLLAALSVGEMRIKKANNWDHFALMGGFIEVRPESNVRILANSAEHAEDIDEARAMEAKQKAEKILTERKEDVSFADASGALERSLSRLKVAQRKRKHKGKGY